jgi:quercetin dioxygenase-like cupin family protein
VHARKHSTLFEDTLESLGMQTEVHAYWQFYHASSLALVNYFHYVTRNKALFFRYLGALFFTEVTLINTAKRQSAMLRSVFGKAVDRTYFDEHHHIDQHHGDMALNRLVAPALERFGDEVAAEVLLGFEQFRLLQREADLDLLAQFEWADELDRFRDRAAELYPKIESGEIDAPLETFVEARGERSTTHVHPNDRLLVIERGSMDFWPLYGEPLRLDEGALMYIPRHRLHGSVVRSAECVYHQPIVGDLHPTAAVA